MSNFLFIMGMVGIFSGVYGLGGIYAASIVAGVFLIVSSFVLEVFDD